MQFESKKNMWNGFENLYFKCKSNAQKINQIQVYNILQNPKLWTAKDQILNSINIAKNLEEWTPEEKGAAETICSNYQLLSSLLKNSDQRFYKSILEDYSNTIITFHTKLEPYITSGEGKWNEFTGLYSICQSRKNAIDSNQI